MYDVEGLKQRTDLATLACRDNPRLRKQGHLWRGPCAKCGGHDRFTVKQHAGAWLWSCNQCRPEWGDVIAYVKWRDGCTFGEACERLGAVDVPGPHTAHLEGGRTATERATLEQSEQPSAIWQGRGRAILARAQQCLWANGEALAYLRDDRGLSDQTIAGAGLGYIPQHAKDRPALWGLEGEALHLWAGWVIPWQAGGALYGLRIRRRQQDLGPGDDKYIFCRGSRVAGVLYGADHLGEHADAILTEGEFDCLLLRQALGDVAGVGTLGSASARPRAEAVATLGRFRRIWAAYDRDKSGQDGLAKIGELSRRVRPLRLRLEDGQGKDITDAWRAGVDLAAWAVQNIGPGDFGQRVAWAEHYLRALQDKAQGDDRTFTLWQALLREYEEAYHVAEGRGALESATV